MRLLCANCGDSRAVLCRNRAARPLSKEPFVGFRFGTADMWSLPSFQPRINGIPGIQIRWAENHENNDYRNKQVTADGGR